MAERKQFEFFLLRYVPDPVKNEFVNVGVALLGENSADLRFTTDWSRVKCMDPDADIEMLEAIEQSLRGALQKADWREAVLKRVNDSFSNMVQLSETKGLLTGDPVKELDELARMYLDTAPGLKTARESKLGARARVRRQMQDAFEREGVWELMWKSIPAAQYGRKGDPLKIDCGYGNGRVRLFHAVTDADAAKLLAFSYPEMKQGIARAEKKDAELAAIVEAADAEESSFARETLQRAEIVIANTSQLPELASRARKELGI